MSAPYQASLFTCSHIQDAPHQTPGVITADISNSSRLSWQTSTHSSTQLLRGRLQASVLSACCCCRAQLLKRLLVVACSVCHQVLKAGRALLPPAVRSRRQARWLVMLKAMEHSLPIRPCLPPDAASSVQQTLMTKPHDAVSTRANSYTLSCSYLLSREPTSQLGAAQPTSGTPGTLL